LNAGAIFRQKTESRGGAQPEASDWRAKRRG